MKERNVWYDVKVHPDTVHGAGKKECVVDRGYFITEMDVMEELAERVHMCALKSQLRTPQVRKLTFPSL
jgi:hypothetical protein